MRVCVCLCVCCVYVCVLLNGLDTQRTKSDAREPAWPQGGQINQVRGVGSWAVRWPDVWCLLLALFGCWLGRVLRARRRPDSARRAPRVHSAGDPAGCRCARELSRLSSLCLLSRLSCQFASLSSRTLQPLRFGHGLRPYTAQQHLLRTGVPSFILETTTSTMYISSLRQALPAMARRGAKGTESVSR